MARRERRPFGKPARKVDRKLALSAEAALRLDVHAVATGRRPAELVEELILTHLRRYHLTDRGEALADGRGGDRGGPGAACDNAAPGGTGGLGT